LNRGRYNYEINRVLWKINAAKLNNAVNLVACAHVHTHTHTK
jgi:hypothetical protein